MIHTDRDTQVQQAIQSLWKSLPEGTTCKIISSSMQEVTFSIENGLGITTLTIIHHMSATTLWYTDRQRIAQFDKFQDALIWLRGLNEILRQIPVGPPAVPVD